MTSAKIPICSAAPCLLACSTISLLILAQMPQSASAVLAVYSMDNNNDNDLLQEEAQSDACDWLDNFDVTQQDISLALLLASSMRRLLNDTLQAWIVPLYTASVFAYLMTIYVQRFQKKQRRKRMLQKQEQEQRTKKPVITLTPTGGAAFQAPTATREGTTEEDDTVNGPQPINLSGLYKLIKIENLDAFLAAQGVPWPLRKAASKVMPVHEITHQDNHLKIRIDAGPIQTSTTYQINGGPVETVVRGRLFMDNVRYLRSAEEDSNRVVGVVNEKTAVTEGYQVTVSRQLSDCNNFIYMQSIASFPNDPAKERIVSTQIFERIGGGGGGGAPQ